MRKQRKLMMGLLLCFMMVTIASGERVAASADDIEFGFTMQPRNAESWDTTGGYRYRQTSNTHNPWRIKMTITTDQNDKKTYYWLDKFSDSKKVSTKELIIQGEGYRTFEPYATANGQNIKLAGCDNNFSASTYWTVGFWDEETW